MSQTNGPSRLEASELTVALQARTIIERLSLRGEAGEFIGLVGPNGAGKTTLLRTLAHVLAPQEGAVHIDGRDLAGMSPHAVAQVIAQVPQSTSLDFGFTCLEVVLMGRSPFLGRFELESNRDRQVAEEALALTGAAHLAQRPITAVSGGERQRVIVARALAQQPRLLLMDEPTANLDIQHQLQVLSLVKGLVREGLTAVAALHDLDLAARYCDRLLLLYEGHVLAEGPPWAVLTPENLATAFGVRAFVAVDPLTEAPVVTVVGPAQSPQEPRSPNAGAHVHVIAGGGRGARVLYLLHEAGYRVTCGILSEEDTDRGVARLLGIETVTVPAFSPLDEESRSRNRALMSAADLVVICPVPIGFGNIANLEDAAAARSLLLLEDQPIADRDYTGGAATERYAALRAESAGATLATMADAVAAVLAAHTD